jgi:hypothetical protein
MAGIGIGETGQSGAPLDVRKQLEMEVNRYMLKNNIMKMVLPLLLLFSLAVNVWADDQDTCISGTFLGTKEDPDKGSGFDMRCSLVCSDGQIRHFSRWAIDELGGGIFTVFDNNGKELFTGHTNAAYKKHNDSSGVYDPGLTFDGLIDTFCKKELRQKFPAETAKPAEKSNN